MLAYWLLVLLGAASAVVINDTHHVVEALDGVPWGWRSVGKIADSHHLKLDIALSVPDEALYEQTLYNISTPGNPRYGKHLTRDELKTMLRQPPGAVNAINDWLRQAGIVDIEDDGEWMTFNTSVSQAEALLETKFEIFQSAGDEISVRTLRYSVPEQLHRFIDMTQPTTHFYQSTRNDDGLVDANAIDADFTDGMGTNGSGTADILADNFAATARNATKGINDANVTDAHVYNAANNPSYANDEFTLERLKDLYEVPRLPDIDSSKSGFAAFNNFRGVPNIDDLASFESKYAPWAVNATISTQGINGGSFEQNRNVKKWKFEATLDLQVLLPIAHPVPIKAYLTAGADPMVLDLDNDPEMNVDDNEPWLPMLKYLLSQPNSALPHTLSTSYGENEQQHSLAYLKKVCNMFGQLGARGVSVILSSGDDDPGKVCQTNNGKKTTRFNPAFPASCPYVTSVGGTVGVNPERAIDYSSGGFSDTWPTPAYQQAAVSQYLTTLGQQWKGLFNPAGRGFPDVAAQAKCVRVIHEQEDLCAGGTSAAAPNFAGIVALLNAYRLKAGKPVMGFLNPWIYSSEGQKGLTDIVDGGSRGCNGWWNAHGYSFFTVPYAGWNATPGWDRVTGYGTPNFPKMLESAMKAI